MKDFKPLAGRPSQPPNVGTGGSPSRRELPTIKDDVQVWERRQVVWRAIERAVGWVAIGFIIGVIVSQAVMR